MKCFVAPFNVSHNQLVEALQNTMGELGLSAQIDHWQTAWLQVSAAPHIEVYQFGNPAGVAALLKSPYFKLAPEDIDELENDPGKRQRYTELVVETIMAAASASSGGAVHDTGALACMPCSGALVQCCCLHAVRTERGPDRCT